MCEWTGVVLIRLCRLWSCSSHDGYQKHQGPGQSRAASFPLAMARDVAKPKPIGREVNLRNFSGGLGNISGMGIKEESEDLRTTSTT